MSVKVIECGCNHQAQDKLYGKGMRVHNLTQKGNESTSIWRCTVCEAERGTNQPKTTTKKKKNK